MLEINPNCSVFYPDDNGATADVILELDGTGKSTFLQMIIDLALYRMKKDERNYIVHLNPKKVCQSQMLLTLEGKLYVSSKKSTAWRFDLSTGRNATSSCFEISSR
jgi:hypothetical protein